MKQKPFSLLSVLLCAGAAFTYSGCGNASQGNAAPAEQRDTVAKTDTYIHIKGRFVENDTVFLFQEYDKEQGRWVRAAHMYLAKDSTAREYAPDYWTARFGGDYCKSQLAEWTDYVASKEGLRPAKVDLMGLPADWIPLHYMEGRPYAFASCGIDVPFRRKLTDSLLIEKNMEFDFYPMARSEKVSTDTYCFGLQPVKVPATGYTEVYVHVIDRDTGVAVWEYRGKEARYDLMLPLESLPRFDLIVCDSWIHELDELPAFDNVDAKALLQAAKSGKQIDLYNLGREYAMLVVE